MTWWGIGAALLGSYLVGSIPTSYLVGRLGRGIDLREHGSKNLGATNLYRTLGWRYALPVALFDIAKGFVPVALIGARISGGALVPLACGVAAVVGHMFSPFVGFRGGKGVATGAGVVLAMAPLAFLVSFGVWLVLVFATGYVSLASIAAAAIFPVAAEVLQPSRRSTLWLEVGLAVLIIWMHRANIGRLLKGTENRFGRRTAGHAPRA